MSARHNNNKVANSRNRPTPIAIQLPSPGRTSVLMIETIWTQNRPIQYQNTANRRAARKKFATLNFPHKNINNMIRMEFPASTNVPAMLMSSFILWVKTLLPHTSVLVSLERQANAGTTKRRVKVSLINQSRAKAKPISHKTIPMYSKTGTPESKSFSARVTRYYIPVI